MTCAGWIRFRASLIAMRRISWIDQRISGGVAMFWLLPGPCAGFDHSAGALTSDLGRLGPTRKNSE
jgi:hypothetical protein